MKKATFAVFKVIMEVIMFTEKLEHDELDELMNEWYSCYKDTKYEDVVEWAKFWFAEVNNRTHDVWLDKRGLMIWKLRGMIYQTGLFQIGNL